MSDSQATTRRTIFFNSEPQLLVPRSVGTPHESTIDCWSVREVGEPVTDSTLPHGTVSYSIRIEAHVS